MYGSNVSGARASVRALTMRPGNRARKETQAEAAVRGPRPVSLLGLLQHREIRRCAALLLSVFGLEDLPSLEASIMPRYNRFWLDDGQR